jgi:HlyD family secretion protein
MAMKKSILTLQALLMAAAAAPAQEVRSLAGTIQPREVIDVGAQVSGQIKELGPDDLRDKSKSVDVGSPVEIGTLLAQIDQGLYAVQVEKAKAGLLRARAELSVAQARLNNAKIIMQRFQTLVQTKAVSQAEYADAEGNLAMTSASVEVSKAGVAQAEAALDEAVLLLRYTTIRSPVKGVILERRVNVGQTVNANLKVPSLFLIATDLKKIDVLASVSENDIAAVQPGQTARFTVPAYPGHGFEGTVVQVRPGAATVKGQVTYTVVIAADNTDGRLRPSMTAAVTIVVGTKK